jgi:GTP-binding protein
MKKEFETPIVAIIGRPNVGKSTLFNRLVGKRVAITSPVAGTTRDRISANVDWLGKEISFIDTAGLEDDSETTLEESIANQATLAIEDADAIVFLVSAQEELKDEDLVVAEKIRKAKKPVVLAVNKAEGKNLERVSDFYKLGLGDPLPISAIHGTYVAEMLDQIVDILKKKNLFEKPKRAEIDLPKIALVGRPNVGKSTLLNSLVGEERVVVSDIPGTTRDSIDMKVSSEGKEYIFIDTAGVRKRGRIEKGIEKYSVMRTFRAILESDLVIVLIDATEGAVRGDVHMVTHALESGKPVLLAINKTDLNPPENVSVKFPFMAKLPVVFISAKTGKGLKILLRQIEKYL